MSGTGRGGLPAIIAVGLGLMAAVMFSGKSSLKSPAETYHALKQLGIEWIGEGPPVVVFSNPG